MKLLSLAGLGAAAGFCAAVAFTHIAQGDTGDIPPSSSYAQLDRFAEALTKVHDNYVTPEDDRTLVENAIDGMTSSLDPHSSYFSPTVFAEMQTTTQGQYGGVGLVIAVESGQVKVISPIDGTPASRAGIKAGDVIMAIDGVSAQGLKLDDVQSKLRGPQGTKVTITVAREGQKDTIDFHLVRADVAVEPVTWRTDGDVGYIKIPAFNDHTDDGVKKAVAGIKAKLGPRLKGYVLDLRNDGGGVLDAAIAVSDDFLDGGEIVSTRGRHPEDMQRYDAHPGDIADGKPILILTNGGTASASEIVAGALQDHRRAKVVGTVTFGKGSVQTIIPLNDGEDGALHLTTGRYYAPSGRSIQTVGIIPDYPVAAAGKKIDPADQEIESEAKLPHHLPAEGPGANATPPPPLQPPPGKTFDDFQLDYAVSLLDGTTLASTAPRPHG